MQISKEPWKQLTLHVTEICSQNEHQTLSLLSKKITLYLGSIYVLSHFDHLSQLDSETQKNPNLPRNSEKLQIINGVR